MVLAVLYLSLWCGIGNLSFRGRAAGGEDMICIYFSLCLYDSNRSF